MHYWAESYYFLPQTSTFAEGSSMKGVATLTLEQIINRLSRSELERLKKCAEYGMYDELLQLLKAYGYDEKDSPASIGQKVKKLIR